MMDVAIGDDVIVEEERQVSDGKRQAGSLRCKKKPDFEKRSQGLVVGGDGTYWLGGRYCRRFVGQGFQFGFALPSTGSVGQGFQFGFALPSTGLGFSRFAPQPRLGGFW